jgi:hypothetical protein
MKTAVAKGHGKDEIFLNFTSEFKPSGVIMLDGLKQNDPGEDHTGVIIFNELQKLNDVRGDRKIFCHRHVVDTVDALRGRLRGIAEEMTDDVAFILHLECHGNEDIIEIGDGREWMTWREFMTLLTPINVKNKCNVGLVLACCDGFNAFKVDDLAAPVPFYFQLSHNGEICSGVLEKSLTDFYTKILTEQDLPAAISAAAPFQIKYSEVIFCDLLYRVMRSQSKEESDEELFNVLLNAMLSRGGYLGNPDIAFNREFVTRRMETFDQRIVSTLRSNMSFFCGRTPAFDLEKLVAWISNGKVLT